MLKCGQRLLFLFRGTLHPHPSFQTPVNFSLFLLNCHWTVFEAFGWLFLLVAVVKRFQKYYWAVSSQLK